MAGADGSNAMGYEMIELFAGTLAGLTCVWMLVVVGLLWAINTHIYTIAKIVRTVYRFGGKE